MWKKNCNTAQDMLGKMAIKIKGIKTIQVGFLGEGMSQRPIQSEKAETIYTPR